MLKDFLLVRAAPGKSIEEVQHYLQHRHAPLALTVANSARLMRRYTMNHIFPGATGASGGFAPHPGFATVVEHELGGFQGIASIMADADYIARVIPDEQFMIETLMDGEPQFVIVDDERIIWESSLPGPVRLFDFLSRPAGMARVDFLDHLEDAGRRAASQAEFRSLVDKRVHSIVGTGPDAFGAGGDEPFDAVVEMWLADSAGLNEFALRKESSRPAFCDPRRSFRLMTRENRIVG